MQIREDVRRKLIEVAKNGKTIFYSDLQKEFDIPRGHYKAGIGIGHIVGEISKTEHKKGNPLLSAIVVHKADNTIGDGFYELARDLRLLTTQNEKDFWIQEQQKVWDKYKKK